MGNLLWLVLPTLVMMLIANEKVVEFRKVKDRGDVAKKICFSYNPAEKNYYNLMNTIARIDDDQASQKQKLDQAKQFIKENLHIINYIKELIHSGVNSQKEILSMVNEMHDHPQKKTRKILTMLTGNTTENGKLWKYTARKKNRYEYRLLSKYEN